MSAKNTPISIYGKNKKLTKVISYTVNGKKYRETISLDTANGDFGKSKMIEEQFTPMSGGAMATGGWRTVTNKDELSTIQDDSDRIITYSNFLQKISKEDGAIDALDASGMKEITEGGIAIGHNIPTPDNTSVASVGDDKDAIQKITPQEIFGGYSDIFKKHLKYPRDMFIGKGQNVLRGTNAVGNTFIEGTGEGSQDYFFIEQFLYKSPQKTKDDGSEKLPTIGQISKTGVGRKTNLGDPMGSCILPIPNRLSVSQGVNWGEGRANAVELGAFSAANSAVRNALNEKNSNLGSILKKIFVDGKTQATETFNEVAKAVRNQSGTANAGSVINAVIARSLLSRIGINVDVNQFITRETGAAINPNLELLFGGPQLRTFSFVFNFAPNDQDEAREVRMIQRWFRQGMLPQKLTNFQGGSLFLGSPNVFRLCYKNNQRRIKGLNTFKICAVTSVQVDFTPDSVYQSYEDEKAVSQPVRSTMAVTFNELTPIFANDYNLDESTVDDPSLDDLGLNISGSNEIAEDDLGF